MGNVNITLDETDINNPNDRVHANKYENIYPGQKLTKDPIVHNVGSYDAYVRVKITANFNQLAGLQEDNQVFNGAAADSDLTDILDIDTANWEYAGRKVDFETRTVTYTYNYKGVLAADTDAPRVFTTVTIPKTLTNEDVTNHGLQEFNIDVFAEAIQVAGFENAEAAYAALDAE